MILKNDFNSFEISNFFLKLYKFCLKHFFI